MKCFLITISDPQIYKHNLTGHINRTTYPECHFEWLFVPLIYIEALVHMSSTNAIYGYLSCFCLSRLSKNNLDTIYMCHKFGQSEHILM